MNRTFKVVFSKARGALMVVNEITSFVQAKGTKTVVAAAAASAVLFAPNAFAAEINLYGDSAASNSDYVVNAGDTVTANYYKADGSAVGSIIFNNLTISPAVTAVPTKVAGFFKDTAGPSGYTIDSNLDQALKININNDLNVLGKLYLTGLTSMNVTKGVEVNAGTVLISNSKIESGTFTLMPNGKLLVGEPLDSEGGNKGILEVNVLNLGSEYKNTPSAVFSNGSMITAGSYVQKSVKVDIKNNAKLEVGGSATFKAGTLALGNTGYFKAGSVKVEQDTYSYSSFTLKTLPILNLNGSVEVSGLFDVEHGQVTVSGNASFGSLKYSGESTPYSSGLATTNFIDFLKISGGTTTVDGAYTQTNGNVIVESSAAMLLNGGADITGGTLNTSGTLKVGTDSVAKNLSIASGAKLISFGTTTVTGDMVQAGTANITGNTTTVKGTYTQTGGTTTVASDAKLILNGNAAINSGSLDSAGTLDVGTASAPAKLAIAAGAKVKSSGVTTVTGGLTQASGAGLEVAASTMTVKGTADISGTVDLTGGELVLETAKLADGSNFKFSKNGSSVTVDAISNGKVNLEADDSSTSTSGISGTFAYNGAAPIETGTIHVGTNDTLNFSLVNDTASVAVAGDSLKLDAGSTLNLNLKKATLSGAPASGSFNGTIALVDKNDNRGAEISVSAADYAGYFGSSGSGWIDLGNDKSDGTKNTLKVANVDADSGFTLLTETSDGTLVDHIKGSGRILVEGDLTVSGGKYAGKPEIESAGKVTAGKSGSFEVVSGSTVTANKGFSLKDQPADKSGTLTVNGTLNIKGGSSDLGNANVNVKSGTTAAADKGLVVGGTGSGESAKVTTTGKLTTNAGGTTVNAGSTLTTGSLAAMGDNAVLVNGGELKVTESGTGAIALTGAAGSSNPVIKLENAGKLTANADSVLQYDASAKKFTTASNVGTGLITADSGTSGTLNLVGLESWVANQIDPSLPAGSKVNLTIDQAKEIQTALGSGSNILIGMDMSQFKVSFDDPVDYTKFKDFSSTVSATGSKVQNVDGDALTGTNIWGSAGLASGVDKITVGKPVTTSPASSGTAGKLTLDKAAGNGGNFVTKADGTVGDVEIVGAAASEPKSWLDLVNGGKIGNITAAGNVANTAVNIKGTDSGKNFETGSIGASGAAVNDVKLDAADTKTTGDFYAVKVELDNASTQTVTKKSDGTGGSAVLGSLTLKDQSRFNTEAGTTVSGTADLSGGSKFWVAGSQTVNLGDLKVTGGSTFGYDKDNAPVDAVLKTTKAGTATGSVTVSGQDASGNVSKVYASSADIAGDLTLSDKAEASFKNKLEVAGKVDMSTGSILTAKSAEIGGSLVIDASSFEVAGAVTGKPATVGAAASALSPVTVKNNGSFKSGSANLGTVTLGNDAPADKTTNTLVFGKGDGTDTTTSIDTLIVASGTGDITFNGKGTGVSNVVKNLNVAADAEANVKGESVKYGNVRVNGTLHASGATFGANATSGNVLNVVGTAATSTAAAKPAHAYFDSLDLSGADGASTVTNGLLSVGMTSAGGAWPTLSDMADMIAQERAKNPAASAVTSVKPATSVLYVNSALKAPASGSLTVGTGAAGVANTITIHPDGGMVMGNGAFDFSAGTPAPGGKTLYKSKVSGNIVNNGTVMLQNVKYSAKTLLQLTDAGHATSGSGIYLSGNFLYTATFDPAGYLSFGLSDEGTASLKGSLSDSLAQAILNQVNGEGFDSTAKNGAGWIGGVIESATSTYAGDTVAIGHAVGQAVESVARFGNQAGVFQSVVMVKDASTSAIEERLGFAGASASKIGVQETDGRALWVTPLYAKMKSDGYEAGFFKNGADADLYGVTMGLDVAATDDARFGVAFHAGSGSSDSEGGLADTSNDFDFYGVTAYFGRDVGAWSFMGDIGYGYVKGDVSQTNHGKVTADIDADIITAGFKAKYAVSTGWADVAPYFGLRVNRMSQKSYTASTAAQGDIMHAKSESKSWAEVPIGIQFSKAFDTASGYAVRPALDLSVTPILGTKTMDSTVHFTGMADSATTINEVTDRVGYGAKFGVSVEKGCLGFGLTAGYTGSENTDGYAVSVGMRYLF